MGFLDGDGIGVGSGVTFKAETTGGQKRARDPPQHT